MRGYSAPRTLLVAGTVASGGSSAAREEPATRTESRRLVRSGPFMVGPRFGPSSCRRPWDVVVVRPDVEGNPQRPAGQASDARPSGPSTRISSDPPAAFGRGIAPMLSARVVSLRGVVRGGRAGAGLGA